MTDGNISRTKFEAIEVPENGWPEWDEWLKSCPESSPFSTSWWITAQSAAFGGTPVVLRLMDMDKGLTVGGIALVCKHTLGVSRVMGGPLYSPVVMAMEHYGSRARCEGLAALLEAVTRQGTVVGPLVSTPSTIDLRAAAWAGWDVGVSWTVINSLSGSAEIPRASRSEMKRVRKAEREGLVCAEEPADSDLLFDLQERTMARQNADAGISRSQMKLLMSAANEHGCFTVVRQADGSLLSAGFVMWQNQHTAYDIWAGNDALGFRLGAPALRYSATLRILADEGFSEFDWCGANLPGVSDFKLEFGGRLVPRYSLYRSVWYWQAMLGARQLAANAAKCCATRVRIGGKTHK